VTSLSWINESYESLLLVGSDDGSVKVWKDSADTEIIAAHSLSPQVLINSLNLSALRDDDDDVYLRLQIN
jgi:WD40 repeat protein